MDNIVSKLKYILFIMVFSLLLVGKTADVYADNPGNELALTTSVESGVNIYYYDNTDDAAITMYTSASKAATSTRFSTVGWMIEIGEYRVFVKSDNTNKELYTPAGVKIKTANATASNMSISGYTVNAVAILDTTAGDLGYQGDGNGTNIPYSIDMGKIEIKPTLTIGGFKVENLMDLYTAKYKTSVKIKMNAVVDFYQNGKIKGTAYDQATANSWCSKIGFASRFPSGDSAIGGRYAGYYNRNVTSNIAKIGLSVNWADGTPSGAPAINLTGKNTAGDELSDKSSKVLEHAYIQTSSGRLKRQGTTSNTTNVLKLGRIAQGRKNPIATYDSKTSGSTFHAETTKNQNITQAVNQVRRVVSGSGANPYACVQVQTGYHIVDYGSMISNARGKNNVEKNIFNAYSGRAQNVSMQTGGSGDFILTNYTIAPNGYFVDFQKTKDSKVGAYIYGKKYEWNNWSQDITGHDKLTVKSLLGDAKDILTNGEGYYVTDWEAGSKSLKKGIESLTQTQKGVVKAKADKQPKSIEVTYYRYNEQTQSWYNDGTDLINTDFKQNGEAPANDINGGSSSTSLRNTSGSGVTKYWTTVANPSDPEAAKPGMKYRNVSLESGHVMTKAEALSWTKDANVKVKNDKTVEQTPNKLVLYEVPLEYYAFTCNTSYTVKALDTTQAFNRVTNEGKLYELDVNANGSAATEDAITFGANNSVFAWSYSPDTTIENIANGQTTNYYYPGATISPLKTIKENTTAVNVNINGNIKKVYFLYAIPGYTTQYDMTYYENTTDKSTHVTEDTGKLTTGKYEMKDISKFTEFGKDVTYVESGKLVDASEVNISNKNIFKELQKTSVYSDGQYLYRFFGWSADHNTLTDTDTNSALYQSHFRAGHVLGGSSDWQTLKAANEPLTDTICYDNVISKDFNTYSTAVIRATKLVNNRVAPPVNTQYLEAKMFAIWDAYPTITQTSTPTICTTDDALSSKDKLIEKLKSIVTAVDIEDGTVPVTISNIDYDEVLRIAQSLSSQQIERLSFLVTAVDKVGNTTYYNARVSIKNNATTPDDYMMTLNEYKQRFINEHYYSLGDKKGSNYANDYSVSNYHNYGGLNPKSKWYLDDSYRIEILDAFKNVEDGTPEEVWTFTGDVVTDAKKYIDVHGFHKWQEESGLINFYNSFKDRAKDKETFTKGEY